MNIERFLNHRVHIGDVYLYKEPNKSGEKANVFYFCLYDAKKDLYLFLNDHKVFTAESVYGILPNEDQIDCMWYYHDEAISKEMELYPEDFEEGDDFYWEIFKTQNLAHFVDCDEFEGDLPESAWHATQGLSASGIYTVRNLLEIEQRFVEEQIKYQQQKLVISQPIVKQEKDLGKSKGRQTILFEVWGE